MEKCFTKPAVVGNLHEVPYEFVEALNCLQSKGKHALIFKSKSTVEIGFKSGNMTTFYSKNYLGRAGSCYTPEIDFSVYKDARIATISRTS